MTPQNFKQFAFFKAPDLAHGGDLRAGKRKIRRPLDPKRPIHLVLKSSRARGRASLLQPCRKRHIEVLIEHEAKRQKIKIYRFANVGNHIHLLVKTPARANFQNFLRIISGKIAILVTKAKKGKKKGKFWDALSFTRVIHWGRDFKDLTTYFIKNEIESFGYGTDIARAVVKKGSLILKEYSG